MLGTILEKRSCFRDNFNSAIRDNYDRDKHLDSAIRYSYDRHKHLNIAIYYTAFVTLSPIFI